MGSPDHERLSGSLRTDLVRDLGLTSLTDVIESSHGDAIFWAKKGMPDHQTSFCIEDTIKPHSTSFVANHHGITHTTSPWTLVALSPLLPPVVENLVYRASKQARVITFKKEEQVFVPAATPTKGSVALKEKIVSLLAGQAERDGMLISQVRFNQQ